MGDPDVLLPGNGNELGRFYGVSLSAGIVEEIVRRGFLIWYLTLFMPVWSVAFSPCLRIKRLGLTADDPACRGRPVPGATGL